MRLPGSPSALAPILLFVLAGAACGGSEEEIPASTAALTGTPVTVAAASSSSTAIHVDAGTAVTATGTDTPALILVVDILDGLVVVAERRDGYDRDLFPHWNDADGDGCDTRREVLLRDSRAGRVVDPGRACRIISGLWYSVYDDVWVDDSSLLDIDHLVPLAEAWDSGASEWGPDRREAFANDEAALIAVTPRSNNSKGAADPAEWMSSNRSYTCTHVAGWVATKARWDLTVDRRESRFLRNLLEGECAGRMVDLDRPGLGVPDLDVPVLEVPGASSGGSAIATGSSSGDTPRNPGNTRSCGDFATRVEAQEWSDTYFPHYGDVARLDSDGDGQVCESLP